MRMFFKVLKLRLSMACPILSLEWHTISTSFPKDILKDALWSLMEVCAHLTSILRSVVSVILNAPAVFEWTACACPDRHLHAASLMGADTTNATDSDAGKLLVEQILELMQAMKIPNGLRAIGYTDEDIPMLVQGNVKLYGILFNLFPGTLPQHRVTKLSPRPVDEEALTHLFERTMSIY